MTDPNLSRVCIALEQWSKRGALLAEFALKCAEESNREAAYKIKQAAEDAAKAAAEMRG